MKINQREKCCGGCYDYLLLLFLLCGVWMNWNSLLELQLVESVRFWFSLVLFLALYTSTYGWVIGICLFVLFFYFLLLDALLMWWKWRVLQKVSYTCYQELWIFSIGKKNYERKDCGYPVYFVSYVSRNPRFLIT